MSFGTTARQEQGIASMRNAAKGNLLLCQTDRAWLMNII